MTFTKCVIINNQLTIIEIRIETKKNIAIPMSKQYLNVKFS